MRTQSAHWLYRYGPLLIVAAVLLLEPLVAVACPTCKETVKAQPDGGSVGAGFSYSIYFMLGMVFSLAGLVGFAIYREGMRATRPVPPEDHPDA